MPAVRKYRRDTSEVSCCLKYVIFGFNVMFWVSTARESRNCYFSVVVRDPRDFGCHLAGVDGLRARYPRNTNFLRVSSPRTLGQQVGAPRGIYSFISHLNRRSQSRRNPGHYLQTNLSNFFRCCGRYIRRDLKYYCRRFLNI